MVQPSEVGGRETQTPYLVVTDCDAIYALAKAPGAEMVLELEEKEYGGKLFTCRNPEGHIWHVAATIPGIEAGQMWPDEREDAEGFTAGVFGSSSLAWRRRVGRGRT